MTLIFFCVSHRTHTSSTAGGNENVLVDEASDVYMGMTISGIAPRAHIITYKVLVSHFYVYIFGTYIKKIDTFR